MTEQRSFTIVDGGRVTAVGEAEGAALAKQAETSGRPVAVDLDERAAYFGISAAERANKDAFLIDLCDVLDVPRPQPTTWTSNRSC